MRLMIQHYVVPKTIFKTNAPFASAFPKKLERVQDHLEASFIINCIKQFPSGKDLGIIDDIGSMGKFRYVVFLFWVAEKMSAKCIF